jgi:hypothetical protein
VRAKVASIYVENKGIKIDGPACGDCPIHRRRSPGGNPLYGEVTMARNGGGQNGGSDAHDRGGSSDDRSANDDRSDVKNPNNDAYDADQQNQADQAERGW